MSKVVFSTKLVRTRDTNIVEQRYRCKNHGGGEEKEGWKRYHRFGGRGRSASTGTPVHNTWRSTPHHGSPVGVVGVEAAVVGVAFYHFLKRIRGLCAAPTTRLLQVAQWRARGRWPSRGVIISLGGKRFTFDSRFRGKRTLFFLPPSSLHRDTLFFLFFPFLFFFLSPESESFSFETFFHTRYIFFFFFF